jgi:hypothetical protein
MQIGPAQIKFNLPTSIAELKAQRRRNLALRRRNSTAQPTNSHASVTPLRRKGSGTGSRHVKRAGDGRNAGTEWAGDKIKW